MNQFSSNKTIAKNTIFLYTRMIVSIVVNLYTVRLLWQVLGIIDYGILNVVGGIVLMFAFLKNAMITSSQRFISYDLGKGDFVSLKRTFSTSVLVHGLIALFFLVIAETIGLWFLINKINIPEGREIAAHWVYQCSVISFVIATISVPYNSCIVAHEHMKAYGWLGIIDVILNLLIVLIVSFIDYDSLILYSVLLLVISIFMRILNGIYCNRNFAECKITRVNNLKTAKEMFFFAGWSFLGNMGFSLRDQGINIILNMFFNVVVNAAKGIANNVGSVVLGCSNNFTMAINPQITKRYAAREYKSMMELVFNGCKYALLLMSIVVIPFIISAESVLKIWLDDLAPYTVGFVQLILIVDLIDSVVSPITTAIQATGKIKIFQITISIIMLINLPISWMLLKLYVNPYIVMIVCIATSIMALISRLIILHRLIPYSFKRFFSKVYKRSVPCITIVGLISYYMYFFFDKNIIGLIGYVGSTIIIFLVLSYLIALNKTERIVVDKHIRILISKIL